MATRRPIPPSWALLTIAAAAACTDDSGRDPFAATLPPTGASVGDSGDGPATGDGADSGEGGTAAMTGASGGDGADDDDGGDDASVFDVGGGEGAGETGPVVNDDECQKIDFLFVIDNSGSMANEQQSLVNSFPGFLDAIGATVNAQNYQLMVVDTDEASMGLCTELCQTFPNCFGTPCNQIPDPTTCDMTLGAGVVKNAQGVECGIAGGDRYIVEGQPDLDETFACVGKVGIGGQDMERPMEAMLEAVTANVGAGACNEGFLRDDAILVVTFITDEEDDVESMGDPAAWKDALVAAKGGNEQAVVVLGLVGDSDVPGGDCGPLGLAEPSPRLRAFADSFAFGTWGSICNADYAPFFLDAVGVIDSACEIFDPEG